jgi:hypothetical protein
VLGRVRVRRYGDARIVAVGVLVGWELWITRRLGTMLMKIVLVFMVA